MSLEGKLSPLGANALSAFMNNTGLHINSNAATCMGASTGTSNYTKGTIISNTSINSLAEVMPLAYSVIGQMGVDVDSNPILVGIEQTTYDALISMGEGSIPALGNSPPPTYSPSYSGVATKFGFLRILAEQAYNEMHYAAGNHSDFVYSFALCEGYKSRINRVIATLENAKGYLDGSYSNMNDLTTSDITGVNLATLYWGQDLIRSGRVIDLAKIDSLGDPINLLNNIKKNNALSRSLSLALLSVGLTTSDLDGIFSGAKEATIEQKRLVYSAFGIIVGADLDEVCIPLNVQTRGLNSLADLLNPAKLFPNSYQSLTVPDYNDRPLPTNSKTYYPIYKDGSLNINLPFYYNYLESILPLDIAKANVALSNSMQQIKNIKSMNIEKFSQVVTHLESTQGLAVNGTSTPADTTSISSAQGSLANGSGIKNQYTTVDFFGAACGIPYKLDKVESALKQLNTQELYNIYSSMNNRLHSLDATTNSDMLTLIAQANSIISSLASQKPKETEELNSLWNALGTQLTIEKNARSLALTASPSDVQTSVSDIISFIDSTGQYASDTDRNQAAQVLEALADLTTPGGQALVGLLREHRNAERLGLAGGTLDNDISDKLPIPSQNGLGVPKVSGDAIVPGSLAGSSAVGLIPQNLDIFQISSAVIPSSMTPAQALDEVIRCNCDCWDLIV